MKHLFIVTLLGLLSTGSVIAQTTVVTPASVKALSPFDPVEKLPVTGTLNIVYNTRTPDGKTKSGVADIYTMQINVANSAVFRGTIQHVPYIKNTAMPDQKGRLTFDLEMFVINPAITTGLDLDNPRHAKAVGKITGVAPIDEKNVYRYSDGQVKMIVFPIGTARGFESRFNGLTLAKPPATSGWAKVKQETVKLVSGKGGAILLTKYDIMSFDSHVLPQGPVGIYPETNVNGKMFYDYTRNAWHFNNLRFEYSAEMDNKRIRASDVLTGSIRWIEGKDRRKTGEGRYDFDVRVNEPQLSESAAFAATANEASFFEVDTSTAGLFGSMRYRDTFMGAGLDNVSASQVTIALEATKLSKVQAMYLAKLILLSAIVPVNAE